MPFPDMEAVTDDIWNMVIDYEEEVIDTDMLVQQLVDYIEQNMGESTYRYPKVHTK